MSEGASYMSGAAVYMSEAAVYMSEAIACLSGRRVYPSGAGDYRAGSVGLPRGKLRGRRGSMTLMGRGFVVVAAVGWVWGGAGRGDGEDAPAGPAASRPAATSPLAFPVAVRVDAAKSRGE